MLEILEVEVRGTGPDVVLLHGTPTAPSHMTPLAERLAASYRTWNVHLPGYGGSAPLVPYDLDASHRRVEEALLARGVRQVQLVGFSGGGYRALALAARKRLEIRGVALIAGYLDLSAEQRTGFVAYARLLREGADLAGALPGLMLSANAQTNAAFVEGVTSWARAASNESLAAELEAFAHGPAVDVSAITAPILARAGELDAALPPSRSEEIARLARAAEVTVQIVPAVGHTLLYEDFAATAAAIEAHLARGATTPTT